MFEGLMNYLPIFGIIALLFVLPTRSRPKLLIPINKYFSNVEKYNVDNSELLITKAIIAAKRRTIPLAASNLKNDINPFVIF